MRRAPFPGVSLLAAKGTASLRAVRRRCRARSRAGGPRGGGARRAQTWHSGERVARALSGEGCTPRPGNGTNGRPGSRSLLFAGGRGRENRGCARVGNSGCFVAVPGCLGVALRAGPAEGDRGSWWQPLCGGIRPCVGARRAGVSHAGLRAATGTVLTDVRPQVMGRQVLTVCRLGTELGSVTPSAFFFQNVCYKK